MRKFYAEKMTIMNMYKNYNELQIGFNTRYLTYDLEFD